MASGIRPESRAGQKIIGAVSSRIIDKIARLGMTARQQELNRLWSWYTCSHYDSCKVDWDGRQHVDPIEREAISTAGFIPPGFYDAGLQFPLKFRRPTAPYNLIKVIVDRFSGMLFSERRHPELRVEGDMATEDFVQALSEASRLWPAMIQARKFGGATGTVAVGFQFMEGRPVVEVHDPRWLHPEFEDRINLKLSSLEKRYIYPVEERDNETGAWKEVYYWYRRVIDKQRDVLYKTVPVGGGEEPYWEESIVVEHDFGFCPVVWVQNLPVLDDLDGEPDCSGIYEIVESIDALLAQANRGTLMNCDPSVIITTDSDLPDIRKGSDNAIKLPVGSNAHYMEITGTGPAAARKMAEELRKYALEVAQCVLEHAEMERRTATEIERVYSTMISKADILREQYGQKCILPLMEMMVEAARKINVPKINENGELVRGILNLPPRVLNNAVGSMEKFARTLGPGGILKIQWPGYFEPTLNDIDLATRAAIAAKSGGLIDDEHATKFIAQHFRIEDVPALINKLRDKENILQTKMMESFSDIGVEQEEEAAEVPTEPTDED